MSVGVVVVGRNEGERLRACLDSVLIQSDRVVYVDSCSSDGSASLARGKGASVIELDRRAPLSAARARNEGLRALRAAFPGLAYVQFVDADCELAGGWLQKAAQFLDQHPRAAAVCGRLRERFPQHSVYNMLCDIEWDMPPGEAKACGGIAMVRASAFESAQGFRADMIAGEEPELCVRLRAAGWRVWRLADEIACHDASIERFGQWWKRCQRCGYSFAAGARLHGAAPERHGVRESRSAWFWGLGLPSLALVCSALAGPYGLAVLGAYPLQVLRLALHGSRSRRENWWRAVFLVAGKFPEMIGQLRFLAHRCMGGPARLIEYK